MNRKILILKNIPRETPGLIEIILKDYRLPYQVIDFDHNSVIEPLENYASLIILGGPESANDKSAKMISELALINKAINSGLPYLGICLGFQTFVKAMGGSVVRCNIPETGFRGKDGSFINITLTDKGREDKLFSNIPYVFPVFQLHGETVQITPGMTLLATGTECRNQVVRAGKNAFGFQFHFEITDELLKKWHEEDPDLMKLNYDDLRSDFESIKVDYQNTGRILFENFLMIAGLLT